MSLFNKNKAKDLSVLVASKAKKQASSGGLPKVFKILSVPLLIGVIAFAVYQCAKHITVGMNTLRTQTITDTTYSSLELYVFRDEVVLPDLDDQTLIYRQAKDGERLGVNATVGTLYTSSTVSPEEIALRQDLINSYTYQLQMLDSDGASSLADLQSCAERIDKSYVDIITNAQSGNLEGAGVYSDEILIELERYRILTRGGTSQKKSEIKAAIASLLSELSKKDTAVTTASGYYYYSTDGFENIFDYGNISSMNADAFSQIKDAYSTSDAAESSVGMGKLIKSPQWYAAVYLSAKEASSFEVGTEYSAELSDSKKTVIPMTLERCDYDADGALLVFSSNVMPSTLSRKLNVKIATDSISGYRVPSSAVIELKSEDGETFKGVYILEGNVVGCRVISVLREYNGYCIVKTYEHSTYDVEEGYSENRSGYEWLMLNDKIITSGTGLYEGKIMS